MSDRVLFPQNVKSGLRNSNTDDFKTDFSKTDFSKTDFSKTDISKTPNSTEFQPSINYSKLAKQLTKVSIVTTTCLLWMSRLFGLHLFQEHFFTRSAKSFDTNANTRLSDLRKINLNMFGFDDILSEISANNTSTKKLVWNETEYPLLEGYYFSPFNVTSKNLIEKGNRESRRVVCWYEGLCYEYLKPQVKVSENVTFRDSECEKMVKHGRWNKAPYPVYFRGAVAWNGNASMQWSTDGGCTPKVYYYRDSFRCLKKHSLYFIGGERSRQTLKANYQLLADNLEMTDDRDLIQPDAPFEKVVKPLQEGKAWSFSVKLNYRALNKLNYR